MKKYFGIIGLMLLANVCYAGVADNRLVETLFGGIVIFFIVAAGGCFVLFLCGLIIRIFGLLGLIFILIFFMLFPFMLMLV